MTIANSKLLQSIHRVDVATFLRVVNLNHGVIIPKVARLISRTADGWLYVLIPLLCFRYTPGIAQSVLMTLIAALLLERSLYYTLKKGFKRNRPPHAIPGFHSLIQASDEFSFPSGHTSAAFLAVTLLILFFPLAGFQFLYIWAGGVALSRIILGVHFPLDTVAGALLGVGTANTTHLLLVA